MLVLHNEDRSSEELNRTWYEYRFLIQPNRPVRGRVLWWATSPTELHGQLNSR